MFRLIYGSDDYLLDRRVKELQIQMEQMAEEVETVIISNDDITAEQLMEMLDFSPLFASSRLVILHKLPLWDEAGKRSALLNQVKDSLLAYIQSPPDGQIVVATASKVSAQNPLVAELKKLSALEEVKKPAAGERLSIIRQEAAVRNVELGEAELRILSESKQELYYIITALDKWALLPDLKVTAQWLETEGMTADSEGAIFAFTDAIIWGQEKKALTELRRLQEAGEPSLKVLATVNRQLMTLSKVKGWTEEGRTPAEIAPDIGDKKGFRTKRLVQDAGRIDWNRLRQLFGMIYNSDLALKTSRLPENMILEYLALSASAKA